MASNEETIDGAVEWLTKAQRLGYYSSNVARLMRAGAESVKSVLSEDEDRSVGRLEQDLEAVYVRLLNKEGGKINAATAQTYVSRTRRLLSDYRGWLKDPGAYKPTARRGRGAGKAKKVTPPAEEGALSFPFAEEPGVAPVGEAPRSVAYRDHTLSMSTGKAFLRIPATLSADDVALLTLIIRSHGPSSAGPADPSRAGGS